MKIRFIPVFALAFLITFQPVLIVFAEEVTVTEASQSTITEFQVNTVNRPDYEIAYEEYFGVPFNKADVADAIDGNSSPTTSGINNDTASEAVLEETPEETGGGAGDPPGDEVELPDDPELLLGGDGGTSKIIETVTAGTKVLPKTDPSSGALVYSYNFSVPPGRNDLTPSISLNYNSGLKNNDSIVGYNWQFDIPSITRLNKYGSENIYEHNDFSSSLTGELTQITSSTSYVSKVDNGEFISYTYSSNYWIAYDKDGTKYTFASSSSARQNDSGDSSRVYQWMLEEVRDTNDNYIKYEYTKDGGQIYPSKITYTGNGVTDGIFEINFNLESHDTSPTMYHADFAIKNNYRVADITIEENNSWVRKYEFDYTTGDAGYRNLLSTITESGRDSLGSTTTLEPTIFTYKERELVGFIEETEDYQMPKEYYDDVADSPTLIQLRDVDGNSYIDVMYNLAGIGSKVWLNNGNGTWDGPLMAYWTIPAYLNSGNGYLDSGARVFDYNGDMFPDITYSFNSTPGDGATEDAAWLNTGVSSTAWIIATSTIPIGVVYTAGSNADNSVEIHDVNGDGLSDFLYSFKPYDDPLEENVYLNASGSAAWVSATSSEWVVPFEFIRIHDDAWPKLYSFSQWVDFNSDGLLDQSFSSGTPGVVFINNGHTWLPDATSTWALTIPFFDSEFGEYGNSDEGVRASDINGDGLTDFIINTEDTGHEFYFSLNTGSESGTSFEDEEPEIGEMTPPSFSYQDSTTNVGIGDINGDGMDDILTAFLDEDYILHTSSYLNNGTPFTDLLTGIETSDGATSSVSYKVSTKYYDENDDLLNPELPIIVSTVSSIETNDGFGATSSESFTYADGDYYFGNSYDRKFAGFGLVTKTDSVGNVSKTYFHQGNDTETSLGEYSDHSSKIGKPYRMEEYDDEGNLYRLTVNKWENSSVATSSDFVKLTRETVLDYDGDADHKDTAVEYTYDAKGSVSTITNWGLVTASTDGTYSDTGSDKSVETITYASSTTARIYSTPSNRTVVDQSATKVRESKYFYDSQSAGVVTDGNLTKEQRWRSGSNYATYEKTYNSTYGTVLTETDPNSNITTYTYDTYNLHVATSTNALSQTNVFTYDYSSGKPTEVKDQNGFKHQTTFDGLDRVTEEKIPDPTTVGGLPVTKTTFSYNDSVFPHSATSTEYLDASTSRAVISYRDGFGRNIQTRAEMEGTNIFSVKDTIYNSQGQVWKESLPYQGTGSARSTATTTTSLFTTYTYDPLSRPLTVTTNLGSTSNAYDQWTTTTTDPGSKVKDYVTDARGNLIQVVENVATSSYSTTYEWNLNGLLTKITDALGNVRNFGYNGVGNRTSAEDLHSSGDTTFGEWAFQYDSAGNMATSGSPVNDIVTYTYDGLNRVTKENWTGGAENEIIYTYDSCTAGVGYLCSAIVTGSVTTSYTYAPTGKVKEETVSVSATSTSFVTTTGYDRQGNVSQIILPDSSRIRYNYNAAGLTETIERRQASTWYDVITDIDYAPTDQVIYLAYTNGVATTNTYDPTKLYRLTNKFTQKSGGSTFQDIDYTYDAVGNITDIDDDGGTGGGKTLTMTYDYLHRLSTVSASSMATGSSSYTQNFFYNEIGNVVKVTGSGGTTYSSTQYNGGSVTSSYANPHAATKIGGVNRSYDRNGNLTANGTLTNTWNYKNELTQSGTGSVTSSFVYNHNGDRLTLATSSGAVITPNGSYEVQGTSKKRMIYLGDQLVATVEDNNGTITPHYTHTDHLNGASIITNTSGTQDELIDYYAFGEQRVDSFTTFKEKRKYTGHVHDDDTGLEYVKARYLNSSYNRFISQDKIFLEIGNNNRIKELSGQELNSILRDPQQLNSYAYAKNNPYKFVDLDGNNPVYSVAMGAYIGLIVNTTYNVSSQIASNVNQGKTVLQAVKNINPKSVLKSAENGAVIGGISGATAYTVSVLGGPTSAVIANPLISASISIGSNIYQSKVENKQIDTQKMTQDAIIAGATSIILRSATATVPGVSGRLPNVFSNNFFTGSHANYNAMNSIMGKTIETTLHNVVSSLSIISLITKEKENSDE